MEINEQNLNTLGNVLSKTQSLDVNERKQGKKKNSSFQKINKSPPLIKEIQKKQTKQTKFFFTTLLCF